MRAPKVLRIFWDTDMRNSHFGLTKLAKKSGITIEVRDNGEFLIFINRAQTMVKALTSSGVLAFYRSPSGRITLDAVQNIPGAFVSDQQFWMEKAIKMALEKKLLRKKDRELEGVYNGYEKESRASA